MKIIVLNGSPKGELSVTMQYVHYVQKKFPQHQLTIRHIAQQLPVIEKNPSAFSEIIAEISSADGVLWAFPVYFLLVHAHYKRFIELIRERGAEDAFSDKYTATLSTSIRFFDHVAHNYMNAIGDDLGMRFTGSFSADMYDLLQEQERLRLQFFASHFFAAIEHRQVTSQNFAALPSAAAFTYQPETPVSPLSAGPCKILILTDQLDPATNLGRMIQRFRGIFTDSVTAIDLAQVPISGGCLGCLQCGYDNTCIYGDRDGYHQLFTSQVQTADILIFAGAIHDRYLSARWKLFFDRSFFNNHRPVLQGKQLGIIISGPLRHIPNLRQALEGYGEMQQINIVDFVTDESGDSSEIDALLWSMAERLLRCAGQGYRKPPTFLGVAGKKLFRDEIYSRLRFPFRTDHQFYQQHGLYDFPQKKYAVRFVNTLLLLATRIPSVRREIYTKRMKQEMIQPLQKVLEKK